MEYTREKLALPAPGDSSELGNYTNKNVAKIYIALLFVVVQCISYLTPPFQSPDEYAHVYRAYLLSQGDIFLGDLNNGNTTGGEIDQGLVKYMDFFLELSYWNGADNRQNESMILESKKVAWSGKKEFIGLPNTATYFPLAYLPQATALFIGEHFNLGVHDSYYLARQLAIATSMGLLWLACWLTSTPVIILAIFSMPMVLMQFGSASLDATAFSLTAVVAALFIRILQERATNPKLAFCFLVLVTFALITTRVNLLPLVLLPLVIYFRKRCTLHLFGFILLLTTSISWVIYTIKTVHGATAPYFASNAAYQLLHPISTIKTLIEIIFSTNIGLICGEMFIGVVGWHFTRLPTITYILIAMMLTLLSVLEFKRKEIRVINWINGPLIIVTAASFAMILFIFLATNPIESPSLAGIQGRYFIPTSILLFYALANRAPYSRNVKASVIVLYFGLLIATLSTISTLANTYWLVKNDVNRVYLQVEGEKQYSIAMSNGQVFKQTFRAKGGSIPTISLLLGSPIKDDKVGIRLSIIDEKGQLIFATDKLIENINQKAWVDIPLSYAGIWLTKYSTYTISLITLTGYSYRTSRFSRYME